MKLKILIAFLILFPTWIFSQENKIEIKTSQRILDMSSKDVEVVSDTMNIVVEEPMVLVLLNANGVVLYEVRIKEKYSFFPRIRSGVYFLLFLKNGEFMGEKKIFFKKIKNYEKKNRKKDVLPGFGDID